MTIFSASCEYYSVCIPALKLFYFFASVK